MLVQQTSIACETELFTDKFARLWSTPTGTSCTKRMDYFL